MVSDSERTAPPAEPAPAPDPPQSQPSFDSDDSDDEEIKYRDDCEEGQEQLQSASALIEAQWLS